jgi:hypothetical protein
MRQPCAKPRAKSYSPRSPPALGPVGPHGGRDCRQRIGHSDKYRENRSGGISTGAATSLGSRLSDEDIRHDRAPSPPVQFGAQHGSLVQSMRRRQNAHGIDRGGLTGWGMEMIRSGILGSSRLWPGPRLYATTLANINARNARIRGQVQRASRSAARQWQRYAVQGHPTGRRERPLKFCDLQDWFSSYNFCRAERQPPQWRSVPVLDLSTCSNVLLKERLRGIVSPRVTHIDRDQRGRAPTCHLNVLQKVPSLNLQRRVGAYPR